MTDINSIPWRRSMIDNLMLPLSTELIALYQESHDWMAVRKTAVDRNLPQKSTVSACDRYVCEALVRLRTLKRDELDFFAEASDGEQRCLLWIALCRCSRLVAEFGRRILHDFTLSYKNSVKVTDYDSFLYYLCDEFPDLVNISDIMRRKLRSHILRTAVEAKLLDESYGILRPRLSLGFGMLFSGDERQDLLWLPLNDDEIRRLVGD